MTDASRLLEGGLNWGEVGYLIFGVLAFASLAVAIWIAYLLYTESK